MNDALASLPWVEDVKVDFDSKTAVIAVKSADYDAQATVAAVEELGFHASTKQGG